MNAVESHRPDGGIMFVAPMADASSAMRTGSPFSGHGGIDRAVGETFGGHTIWFVEIDQSVARVFSHHWPDAPEGFLAKMSQLGACRSC